MLSLVLVALIAAMAAGAEIPLDMAAAAHPAVKSAVSLGGAGGVPIVSGAAIGANYNQAVCPSGIGCGVGGMWQSPLKTGDHNFNVEVTNVPKPKTEMDVYHVNDDVPPMFVNKDAMHVTPEPINVGVGNKAASTAPQFGVTTEKIPLKPAKLEAITPVTLHQVLPMKQLETKPVEVKLPVVKVDQVKLAEHQCPNLTKCDTCVAPPEPNCSRACPMKLPYSESCPKCKDCNCPDCEACNVTCPACERPHYHVVCPKCDCARYLSCEGGCPKVNCTQCPQPVRILARSPRESACCRIMSISSYLAFCFLLALVLVCVPFPLGPLLPAATTTLFLA